MNELGSSLIQQLQAWSVPEIAAVVLAVAYLVLVIRQNIWCWLCAGISSAIYVWLFIGARLYMESALYFFYVVMAVYGWYLWYRGAGNKSDLPVVNWPLRVHLLAGTSIVVVSLVAGWLLSSYTDAAYPYIDSLTTFFSFWATFLVARKVFENWWYWLAIDFVSLFIYWSRDLQLTAVLFVFYIALIPIGMREWRRTQRSQA